MSIASFSAPAIPVILTPGSSIKLPKGVVCENTKTNSTRVNGRTYTVKCLYPVTTKDRFIYWVGEKGAINRVKVADVPGVA